MKEKIGIAADHGGKALKALVADFLNAQGVEVRDFGSDPALGSVDYPDYAEKLARAVAAGEVARGIAICGTGIGMSIAANKVPGARAALVWDEFTARMSRQHNDANVLCLGERVLNHTRALDFIKIWLDTPFEGGRHGQRVAKINALDAGAPRRS